MTVDLSAAVNGLKNKLGMWLESVGDMIPNLIVTAIVLIFSWYLAKLLKKGAQRTLDSSKMNRAAASLIATFIRVLVFMGGVTVALGVLNLDKALASIIAGAGVVGLALGFAFQDLAVNLISGVGLAVNREKPFKIGDVVETNDIFGKVHQVDLRTSTIVTLDGKVVVIPNKQIYQSTLINHSSGGDRRADVVCGVSYADDLRKVRSIVLEVLSSFEFIHKGDKPAEVFFEGFGDSSINFVARFWTDYESERSFLHKKSQVIIGIREAFSREGITIPFPIRTLDFGISGGSQLRQQLGESAKLL